jgi:hypothetical protein
MKAQTLIGLICVCVAVTTLSDDIFEKRRSVVLRNEISELVVDIAGGSYRSFRFLPDEINPLNWGWKPSAKSELDEKPRTMGHFLCLDRWGPPSASEGQNGMPYHGEATHVTWQVESEVVPTEHARTVNMKAMLPMAGLEIGREIRFSKSASVFMVRETVVNRNKLGRIFNMVQHPSIGPPFLDETTVVDCNGRRGFAQGGDLPNPEEPSFYWPSALDSNGKYVDLRHLGASDQPNVVSYVIDEPNGWITALNPKKRLLIGYLWKTEDYPWIDLWRRSADGSPNARGLEFGTAGLHQPFPILTKKGNIFGRTLFEYLDAGESTEKRFVCFLARLPVGFGGVDRVSIEGEKLLIVEREGTGRTVRLGLKGIGYQ